MALELHQQPHPAQWVPKNMASLSRSRCGVLMHAAVVMWVVALATAAQAGTPRAVREKRSLSDISTIRGKLETYWVDFVDGDHAIQVTLDGKVLFSETDYYTVAIAASYPEKEPARVML